MNSSRFTLIAVQKSRHSRRVLHGSLPLPSLLLLLTMTLLADFPTDSLAPRESANPSRTRLWRSASTPGERFCPRPLSRVHNARNFDIYWLGSLTYLNCTRCAVALSQIDKISTSTSLHHPLGVKTFLLFAANSCGCLKQASVARRAWYGETKTTKGVGGGGFLERVPFFSERGGINTFAHGNSTSGLFVVS